MPPSLTVRDAAALLDSQIFSVLGTIMLLPIIRGYFAFVFWTFRAKAGIEGGDH